MNAERVHYRTCHLCEAVCGVEIRLRGDQILSIRGDDDDPFSRGHICPKAVALKDVHEDPDRLRQPMRKTADGQWQPVAWEAALDEIARRLVALQREHGYDAVATYFGNPMAHSYSALLYGAQFARSLRTKNRYSATSVDQLPHHLAAYLMYGHQLLIPIPDIDRTQFLLAIGANPVASNGSLMTAPDVARRIKAIGQRGGRVVVVDPRRSETAAIADTHLFIRPGTDALLLLALLNVILAEDLAAPGRLRDWVDGWDTLQPLVADYTPDKVAGPTGIPPEQIRELARDFAAAPAAVCYGRMGASTQEFGALCQWLIQVLNIVTGNLDRSGGAMFTLPAVDALGLASGLGQRGAFDRRRTRVRGLPEFGGEFPVAALAEEILTPGPGQIRALVTAAGNPVLSTPNGSQLERALRGLDFMVAVDFYINETTCHADFILPPTFALERDHYDLIFNLLAIRNVAKYSQPLFEPEPGARHDWQIFRGLQGRIEALDPKRRGNWRSRLLARWLTPQRLLDIGLRRGPYGAGWRPGARGLSLKRLARSPHGIDLGPLQPALPKRLATANRRIQLAPALLAADLARLAARPDTPAGGDRLSLIGRRHLRSNNSWMHNSHRLVKGPNRCTLLIHPADAARRGISQGALATVRSRVGAVDVPVEISDEVMPGTVSLPHGFGHARPDVRLSIATAHAGASANDLTDDQAIDALCGNAALNGVPVLVMPAVASPGPTERLA